MINDTDSYPLKWPINRERTIVRKSATFRTTIGKARDSLMKELQRLGANDIILSSNIATYERGGKQIMYADQNATVKDPGIACYYTWKGDQYVLTCDKWDKVVDNLQAIMKTIEAIRGIERWGSGEMLKAAFQGFKELQSANGRKWYEVLNCNADASEAEIKANFKNLAWMSHPDRGGTVEWFQQINTAYEQGIRAFKK